MAKRRFQDPKPFREGNWWWITPWQDVITKGGLTRKRKRMKVAPAGVSAREAQRIAAEMLRPVNQGFELIGSATQFRTYVEGIYRRTAFPLLSNTTRSVYSWVLEKYLLPVFGESMLRDLDTMTLQAYFSGLGKNYATAVKVKDALASVLGSAVKYGLLAKNAATDVQIPSPRTRKRTKPYVTPEQFDALLNLVNEPYATMIYVCVMAGLRVSELIGLKWEDVHSDALTIDERYSKGEWGCPKTTASSATIGVDERVIQRINRLKDLKVTINWGARGAKKTFKAVASAAPGDLVFQSLVKRKPMSDHNVLSRHIKPAARKLGIGWVNWQVLRRSYATWMVEAGADPKAVQAQMRHARISTTMDIYSQFVPASQRRAVAQMMVMVDEKLSKLDAAKSAAIN